MNTNQNPVVVEKRIELSKDAVVRIDAQAGGRYHIVDALTGKTPANLRIVRQGDDLILIDPELNAEVTIDGFWQFVDEDLSAALVLDASSSPLSVPSANGNGELVVSAADMNLDPMLAAQIGEAGAATLDAYDLGGMSGDYGYEQTAGAAMGAAPAPVVGWPLWAYLATAGVLVGGAAIFSIYKNNEWEDNEDGSIAYKGEKYGVVGKTLHVAVSDADGVGAVSYAWYRDGERIEGANGPSYTLTSADAGRSVYAEARYEDGDGKHEVVVSNPVLVDSEGGRLELNHNESKFVAGRAYVATPTVASSLIPPDQFAYQWYIVDAKGKSHPIPGANGPSYTPTSAEAGAEFYVVASHQGENGSFIFSSANYDGHHAPVVPPQDPAVEAPENVQLALDGVTVTGKAPKGSKVTIKDKDGKPLETTEPVTADGSGNFTAHLKTHLETGAQVKASANKDGKDSSDSDPSAPLEDVGVPRDVSVSPDGATVKGKAPVGSKVKILGHDGKVLETVGDVTVDASGAFTAHLKSALGKGSKVSAKAFFGERGSEPSAEAEVGVETPKAPENVQLALDGVTVTGKAPKGSKVTIKDKDGKALETVESPVTADPATGEFKAHLKTALAKGARVKASANDGTADSQDSAASEALGDVLPPTDVSVGSDGKTVKGKAQPGAKIVVTDAGGVALAMDPADVTADMKTGEFTATLKTSVSTGSKVKAKASFGTRESDLSAEAAVPAVEAPENVQLALDGVTVTGKAEAGAKITIKDKDGKTLETTEPVTADGSGNFTAHLKGVLAQGAQVKASANDGSAESHDSAASEALGDVLAPTDFAVKSNGSTVKGKAQPGAKIVFMAATGTAPLETYPDEVTADMTTGEFTATLLNYLLKDAKITAQASFKTRASKSLAEAVVPAVDVPESVALAMDGATVTGWAQPGATITIKDMGGKPLETEDPVTADASGNFTAHLKEHLGTGAQVTASAKIDQDVSKNSVPTKPLEDVTTPTDVNVRSNGVTVRGYAQKGAKIVLTDGKGNHLDTDGGDVVASESTGIFEATLKTKLDTGSKVKAQAVFGDRGSKDLAETEVPVVDTPWSIEVELDGVSVSGWAQPLSTVTVMDKDGKELETIGEPFAYGDGDFQLTLKQHLDTGAQIKIVTKTRDGTPSAESKLTEPLEAIPVPTDVTVGPDGKTVKGKALPKAMIVLKDSVGKPLETIDEVQADFETGEFTATLQNALPKRAKVFAEASFGERHSEPSLSFTYLSVFEAAPESYITSGEGLDSSSGATLGAKRGLSDGKKAVELKQSGGAVGEDEAFNSHHLGSVEGGLERPSDTVSARGGARISGGEQNDASASSGKEGASVALEPIGGREVANNAASRGMDGKEERSGASRSVDEKSEGAAHQTETEVREALADGVPAQTEKAADAAAPQGAARASERSESADARETAPDQGQEGGKLAETSADGAVQPAPEAGEQSEALNPAHVELAGNPELAAAPAPMFLGSGYDFGSLNLSTESLAPSNAGDEGLWAPGSGLGVVDFAAGADEPAPTIGANVINLGGKEDARLPGEADDDKPQSSEAHYEYGSDGSLSDSAGASPLDQNGHHGIL